MSDNWIRLIPTDPYIVPSNDKQTLAKARFSEIAPEADEIESKVFETVQFVDCGGNFERMRCPSCCAEVPVKWWGERMTEDYDNGFKMANYTMPCCGARHSVHEIIHEWPQGFGRFVLDVMNPRIGMLTEEIKKEFEDILGMELRVIYQHI